jgi:hypothetical protein
MQHFYSGAMEKMFSQWFANLCALTLKNSKATSKWLLLLLLFSQALFVGLGQWTVSSIASARDEPLATPDSSGMFNVEHPRDHYVFVDRTPKYYGSMYKSLIYAPDTAETRRIMDTVRSKRMMGSAEIVGFSTIYEGLKHVGSQRRVMMVQFDDNMRYSYSSKNGFEIGTFSPIKGFSAFHREDMNFEEMMSRAILESEGTELVVMRETLALLLEDDLAGRPDISPEQIVLPVFLCLSLIMYFSAVLLQFAEEKRSGALVQLRQMNVATGSILLSYVGIFGLVALVGSLDVQVASLLEFGRFFAALVSSHLGAVALGLFFASFCTRPMAVNAFIGLFSLIWTIAAVVLGITGYWHYLEPTIPASFAMMLMPIVAIGKSAELVLLKNVGGLVDDLASTVLVVFGGVVLLLVLAWYISHVGGHRDAANREGAFFFLSKAYWLGGSRAPSDYDQSDTLGRLQEESRANGSVVIQKLTKTYQKGATALKELSLTLESGQCYAVLGQNGAGKRYVYFLFEITAVR